MKIAITDAERIARIEIDMRRLSLSGAVKLRDIVLRHVSDMQHREDRPDDIRGGEGAA